MDPASAPCTQVADEDEQPHDGGSVPRDDIAGQVDGAPVAHVPPPPPLSEQVSAVATTNGPSHRDRVWTFLTRANRSVMRTICRELKVVQRGTKNDMAENAFQRLCEGREYDTIWHGPCLSHNEADAHRAFTTWDEAQTGHTLWETVPAVLVTSTPRPFCADEFARLVVLLATNDNIRNSLMSTGNVLARQELDMGSARTDFWKDQVEVLFNDATVRPTFPFIGAINDVDCSAIPLHHRKGDDLKRYYKNARSDFTKSYLKWSASGNNNPSFDAFCERNLRTDELNSKGLKCMILFQVLLCGTDNERKDLLSFTLRTVPADAMRDTGESEASNASPSGSARKKRRLSKDVLESSVEKLKSFLDEMRAKQTLSARYELLKQMDKLKTMIRNLGPDEDEDKTLLTEMLEKVRAELRS